MGNPIHTHKLYKLIRRITPNMTKMEKEYAESRNLLVHTVIEQENKIKNLEDMLLDYKKLEMDVKEMRNAIWNRK